MIEEPVIDKLLNLLLAKIQNLQFCKGMKSKALMVTCFTSGNDDPRTAIGKARNLVNDLLVGRFCLLDSIAKSSFVKSIKQEQDIPRSHLLLYIRLRVSTAYSISFFPGVSDECKKVAITRSSECM